MTKLLIVDDHEEILNSFRFHFESIGWTVEVARNGDQAIKILTEKPQFFDSIILDKNMPQKSGDQVVQWLYDQELLDDICVVLLTGFPAWESAINTMRLGVWQYLIKDMTPSAIQTFIAPGIVLKKILRMKRELWAEKNLSTVLDRIQAIVSETVAADLVHVIFLSPFLSRDLSDGSSPNPDRAFVKEIRRGRSFISARSRQEVTLWEPVLPNAQTLMAVPVRHAGEVLGVLEIESMKEGAFDPRFKEVLTSLAEIITTTQVIHEQRVQADLKAKQAEEEAKEKTKQRDLVLINGELNHRIANSISIIKQSVQDLALEGLSPPARERVNYIAAHSLRIENVLRELKDLSNTKPVTVQPTNVTATVQDVAGEWLTRSSSVPLKVSLPRESQIYASADEENLREALDCLIKNAFEATDERMLRDRWDRERQVAEGGAEPQQTDYWIDVKLSSDDNWVTITVSDNGVGFDAETGSRLFNPLFSTKNRRDNLNLGYGLYTSERVVKAMGGSVVGQSDGRNKGARFSIHLVKSC